jgi:phosphatidylglycerophosphatase C
LVESVERKSQPSLAARDLLHARLEAVFAESTEGVLAFDADGTLWSGDVGEDVFHLAVKSELLLEPARAELARIAEHYGLSSSGTPSQIALRLFDAYLSGIYPERDVCSMMSWCYAGWSLDDLRRHARRAFAETHLAGRLFLGFEWVFELARKRGIRAMVVSASPQAVVEEAAAHWNVRPEDVIACRPATEGERILPSLAAPVPYAAEKPAALARATGGRSVLASFGDNVFDIELLRTAQLAVAVRPKPGLRARLAELPGVVVLE